MRGRVRTVCAAGAGALLAAGFPSAAPAKKSITGELSKRGYDVIALTASGKARVVHAASGRFRIERPPAVVTLHLRNGRGVYAGPIVVAKTKNGKRAIVAVKAGARLGKVEVKPGKGFARVEKKLAERFVANTRKARAKKGVPIGAGRFGRVRSKNTGGGAPGDRDLDGIADALDIDDDGDLVIDSLDRIDNLARSNAARVSQGPEELFDQHTGLSVGLDRTANANVPGVIEDALPDFGRLLMEVIPGDLSELDCGDPDTGRSYCRKTGSTGKVFQAGVPSSEWPAFPGCCDPDGDGFGTMVGEAPPGGTAAFMFLQHGATSAKIKTGDVLIERVTTDGVETPYPSMLQFVFGTVPALVSYSDEAGNGTTVPYPVPPGGPGTGLSDNGFPVADGSEDPDSDVELTLTFWRPQRRPIPPETGEWWDIGGLTYQTIAQHLGNPPTAIQKPCPQESYSTTDEDLTVPTSPSTAPGFTDKGVDQPASPASTVTYTLNVSQCLASLGVSWNPGVELGLDFFSHNLKPGAGGSADQNVAFELQP